MRSNLILLIAFIGVTFPCFAQTEPSGLNKVLAFPGKLSSQLSAQQSRLESQLDKQTEKYLRKLQRQEQKLQRKLDKQDSALVASLQLGSDSVYHSFRQTLSRDSLQQASLPRAYSGKLDSMTTALRFLEKDPRLAALNGPQLTTLKNQYQQLGGQLNQTDRLKQLVQQRRDLLKEKLTHLPLGRAWTKYQREAIYYQQQLDEYKRLLEDPNQWEQKALAVLSQVPAFRKFFDKYSVLGSMFRLPGQVEDMDPSALLNGLQTRDAVLANITQRMGSTANAQQVMASGLEAGQADLASLKEKLNNALEGGESLDMPGFKPNQQRTKSFLQRIELGTNLQSTRSNNYFPVTSDLGLSLGYRLSGKSVVGIGASYKMGWGQDIRHIRITHQGMGLRFFADWKPKVFASSRSKLVGSLWLTGGGEWNYRTAFNNLAILKAIRSWNQSVLFGLQKKQQLGKYKATVSVLYDALWLRQIPKGQPIVFRVGYQLK